MRLAFKDKYNSLLNEAAKTAAEVFVDQAQPEDKDGRTIEQILDAAKRIANKQRQEVKYINKHNINDIATKSDTITAAMNPCFIGPTGSGKTSIIKQWALKNNLQIVDDINFEGDPLDFTGIKDIDRDAEIETDTGKMKAPRVTTTATRAFDVFLKPPMKILFIDEINKANLDILKSVFDLISFHRIQSGDVKLNLPYLLFVTAAMNPTAYGSGRNALDAALKGRMKLWHVDYDIPGLKKYMQEYFDNRIKAFELELDELSQDGDTDSEEFKEIKSFYDEEYGTRQLLDALLTKKFKFSDATSLADSEEDEPILIPRTLENALKSCNGTKASLISEIRDFCGAEAAQQASKLLSDYKDSDHKSNKIWGMDFSVKKKPTVSKEDIEAQKNVADNSDSNVGLKKNLFDRIKDVSRKD